MRVRHTLAVVVTLAVAGCDRSPSAPAGGDGQRTRPVDPSIARAQSTDCPDRCAYAIDAATGNAGRRVLRVTEDARLLGSYGDSAGVGVFTWSLRTGTATTALRSPAEGLTLSPGHRNGWGQTVGAIGGHAAAWEPDGMPAYLRGAGDARVVGGAEAINENSVVAGTGYVEGDSVRRARPFRYHYQDGFQYLSPAGTIGYGLDVNDAGMIVGAFTCANRCTSGNWFIWTPAGGFRDMGPGWASAVSEGGHVVGNKLDGRPFLYTPEGETLLLPNQWEPVEVNEWGEVLLKRADVYGEPDDVCGAAVWYKGYGLIELRSPVPGSPVCHISSINSWGDIAGTVSTAPADGSAAVHTPVVWTWSNNAYRFGR